MNEYVVWYDNWGINVKADTVKKARHKAYVKFNETYPTEYGKFMRLTKEVEEVKS